MIVDETHHAHYLASRLARMPQCTICGVPFTLVEWDDRHDMHEQGCNRDGCDCDYPVHAGCCPDCKPKRGRL